MNSIISTIKKAPSCLAHPVFYLSAATAVISIISLFPVDAFKNIGEEFENGFNVLFLVLCGGIIGNCVCKNSKKAATVSFCLLLADVMYFSFANYHFSLLFIVCASFLLSYFVQKFDVLPSYLSCLVICVTIGLVSGSLYYIFDSLINMTAETVSGNGALFGLFDNLYLMLFGTQFRDIVLTKSYSTAQIVGGNIVSGALNVFKATVKNPTVSTSYFLSGKYFLNIFVTVGAYLAFVKKMDLREQVAFSSAALIAILFGKTELFLIYIICFNPISYFEYLAIAFVSYLTASFLDLRLGYSENGSLIELFKYSNNMLYFIIAGTVLAALTYFLFRIVITKYDFESKMILPRVTNKLVKALGGDENIIKVENGSVIVSNPNLIDVLKVDCEIHENTVTLYYDDYLLLKEYY